MKREKRSPVTSVSAAMREPQHGRMSGSKQVTCEIRDRRTVPGGRGGKMSGTVGMQTYSYISLYNCLATPRFLF